MPSGAYHFRFCSRCGCLLDMPSRGSAANCPLCHKHTDLKALGSLAVHTSSGPEDLMRRYGIEPIVVLAEDQAVQKAEKEGGRTRAKVQETCPKCGNKEMEFYTMQLRSADEGQTVFYECPKCQHKFSLNS